MTYNFKTFTKILCRIDYKKDIGMSTSESKVYMYRVAKSENYTHDRRCSILSMCLARGIM